MKLFPHILSRVGGMPIEEVNVFEIGYYDTVKILLRKDRQLLNCKSKITHEFYQAIESTTSPYLKSILINAFRDFKKGRDSYVKKLIKTEADEVKKLVELAIDYEKIWRIRKNIKSDLKDFYVEKINDSFLALQKMSENENFQKGILQSSQSVYQRILSFQNKPIDKFRKKERQTARSLTQYIYRTATKTSPFSHFTTIDLLSKKDGIFQSDNNEITNSFLQFNNFLLSEIQELLLQDPEMIRLVEIDLNPSIREDYEDFYFIKNEKNIETFQRLELSEALTLVQNKLLDGAMLNGDLLDEIQEDIDESAEEVKDFLFQLLGMGFLEWKWKINGSHRNWEDLYYLYLNSFPEFDENNKWVAFFYYLVDIKNFYKKNEAAHRLPAQNQIAEELKYAGLSDTRPEIILFEDVLTPRGFSIEENQILPIIDSLDILLQMLEPLMENEMQNKIKHIYSKHFGNNTDVPLVRFYELFFQEDFEEMKLAQRSNSHLKKKWKEAIAQTGKMTSEGTLHFSINKLKEKVAPTFNSELKYSGLFQFYKENGKAKAVINGLSPGHGKLFGRFLHLFSEKITIELQEWNKSNNGILLLENIDASYYNVNVHPPLVSHEIKMHNSQNKISKENQIPISEIDVVWEAGADEPALYFSKNKTQQLIEIVDLGFENPVARSPMFQLLNGFAANHGTYRIFVNMVNEFFVQENEEGIRFYPRIVIDEHLILQRKSQIMDVSFFPKINKNDHAAEFFYKMQQFKNLHSLPQYIFVQPIRDFSNPENILKQDFYKPQFIDLHAPISMELLKSIVKKHVGKIKVEEMLPMQSQLDSKYVREDVVQWKR